MTLTVRPGSDWRYVAHQVGKGVENYYTSAVEAGEPPGQWRGSAAPGLGLEGQVSDLQLEALYGNKIDPRDPHFLDRDNWDQAQRLGRKAGNYKTAEDHLATLVAKEPDPNNIEPERLEELQFLAEKNVRNARDFFDLTYSGPKSVSVAYTAFKAQEVDALARGDEDAAAEWGAKAQAVEKAVWDASGAMIEFMENNAGYSRAGYQGGVLKDGSSTGRYIDAHQFTVASFLQHTSRPVAGVESPQLHVHNLVLNKVECSDGVWRTLDGKALYTWRAGAGAVADRTLMAQMTRELGVQWEYDPRSKSFEIVGIDRDVRDLFSPRRAAINELMPKYVEAFQNRVGRAPHALELSHLAQKATLHSRDPKLAKAKAKTMEARVEQWAAQVREAVDTSLVDVAEGITADPDGIEGKVFDPDKVIAQGIASVQEVKATWTRSDLMAHMQRHMPGELANLDQAYQKAVLAELAERAVAPDPAKAGQDDEVFRARMDKAQKVVKLTAPEMVKLPPEFLKENGESAYRREGAETYSTRALMQDEAQIESTAATDFGAVRIPRERAEKAVDRANARLAAADPNGKAKLGQDQTDAIIGVLTSGNRSETLIGPAGTGKSFVLGNLADIWEKETGGRVYGLATAQNAANVLKDEGIRNTDNIERWLERQNKIDNGTLKGSERSRWTLGPRDIVFVDEASMASTPARAEIERRVAAAGAKIVPVGDDKQLGAVGPGGSMRLAADAGTVYELSDVRRFNAAWERDASLRLRDGDDTVLREYDARGRIVRCENFADAQQKAGRAYVADLISGARPYLEVDTNEQAFDTATGIRNQLVQYGIVAPEGVTIGQDRQYAVAGVGDIIAARKNKGRIKDAEGNAITNRNLYKVVETHERGDLTVRSMGDNGELGAPMTVPARYAQKHVSLAYAMTQHGVQGKTGGTSRPIIGPHTSAEAAYVGLTRGRDENVAYVYDDTEHTDPDTPPRPATSILADVITRDNADRSATQTLRDNLEDAGSMRVFGSRLVDAQEKLTERRYDDLVADIAPHVAARLEDDVAKSTLYRMLDATEQAGHDPGLVLQEAIGERELGTAESVAKVLHHRIENKLRDDLAAAAQQPESEPAGDTYAERLPDGSGELYDYAAQYAQLADQRAAELGDIQANRPAPWALDHLGPVPADPLAREEWATKAGRVAAYREAYNITDDAHPIGRAPAIHNNERRGEWHAAWRALGRPDQTRDEQTMTPAQLQNAIDAYEAEKAWAPDAVSAELRETSRALAAEKERATLATAEARTLDAEADERRAELFTQAAEATAKAAELEERRAKLETVNQTRGEWRLATTKQREAADAAKRELARRAAAAEAHGTEAEPETAEQATPEPQAEHTAEQQAEETAEHQPERAEERQAEHEQERTAGTEPETAEQQPVAEEERTHERGKTAGQELDQDAEHQPEPASEPQAEQGQEREPAEPVAEPEKAGKDTSQAEPVDVDKAVAAAEAAAERLAAQAQQRDAEKAAQREAAAAEATRQQEAAEAARRSAGRETGPELGL